MGVCLVNGVIVWMSSNAAPIFDAAGQLEGVVASFTDISAQ
jgi:hypothetical protein